MNSTSNKIEKYKNIIVITIFLCILGIGWGISSKDAARLVRKEYVKIWNKEINLSSVPNDFEVQYNEIYSKMDFNLNVFSLTQRVLCKREARNFEVLKSKNGILYLHGNEEPVDIELINKIADEYALIYDETESYGGEFLYVQCPYKNVGQVEDLQYYSQDNVLESEDYLVENLHEKGIPVLDLRVYDACKYVYNTDHHWNMKSAFNAANIISQELVNQYNLDLPGCDIYGDIDNYDEIVYEDCFLGSIGIKVGPFFAGKDDFIVYKPKFDTKLSFVHYKDNVITDEYSGDFWETFVDQELLENQKYNNKYDANMHGAYVESIIENHMADNNTKGLLIAHSYGRSMAQYLSLNFSEFRYLDPQRGRFNDNYIDYIKSYQPDVVILMYNGEINVGDGR